MRSGTPILTVEAFGGLTDRRTLALSLPMLVGAFGRRHRLFTWDADRWADDGGPPAREPCDTSRPIVEKLTRQQRRWRARHP